MNYYLYGLQRSGTNVLTLFLNKNFNISIKNKNDDRRQSASHKHFRIYDEKNVIPETNEINQFINNYIINSIEDLDKVLGVDCNAI
jgi:agmatine/peptidylarginine deiminase